MKTIKIFQIATICIGISLAGVTVSHAQGRTTPEQRAQNQLDKMKTELSLTDDQVSKIKPILTNRQVQMVKLRSNGTNTETTKAQIKTVIQESEKQIDGILTPEQLQKYKNMKSHLKANKAPNGGGTQQPGK